MRLSATEVRGTNEESRALFDALERADELGLTCDTGLLSAVAPWIERAREAIAGDASARELQRLRVGLERSLAELAAEQADALVAGFEAHLDELLDASRLLSPNASELVAVIVDGQSPDVPLELCARRWPVSVELARTLAEDLRETAPGTADWLLEKCDPAEHRVVVFTCGRIMRTTRRIPSYADA